MDQLQEKMHLKILVKRIEALGLELRTIQEDGREIDRRYALMKEGLETIKLNREERLDGINSKYTSEIAQYQKQTQLADEMLKKKQEERQTLLDYVSKLDLNVSYPEDLKDFDWDSINKIVESFHRVKEEILEQHKKAEVLYDLNQRARQRLNEAQHLFSKTSMDKERLLQTLNEFREHSAEWHRIMSLQSKRLFKLQGDNERLNLLIRQCVVSNEPMSVHVTKNIHAKCQSFINSNSSVELNDGLLKFKERQERIIKLLKYKDNQLGNETNKLQVARDQTIDQMRFYKELIEEKRTMMERASLLNLPTNNME